VLKFNGKPFTHGRSRFSDHSPEWPEPTAKIYVKVRFDPLADTFLAQLDTGAAWSILASDTAVKLGLPVESGDPMKLGTRFGTLNGFLIRAPLTLIAEEGEDLHTEATFFVSADWPRRLSFLGYSGLMDSIRFAVDPLANDFYFG
jgi:hypothetical protein